MPIFRHQSEDETRELAERQAVVDQSIESLEHGGLPVKAQQRLAELRADPNHLFTSDLSVSEFSLVDKEGFVPITQVMGSAFYHVGWQGMYGRMMMSQELDVISQAHRNARHLALGRLQQEAAAVAADAVVGVHLKRANYEWATSMIEYTAIGTAVRLRAPHKHAEPSLTDLSGQDFWKLYQAGFWPVGIAGGTCVFYQVASWNTQQVNWSMGGFANQELRDYTYGLMTARELAASDMRDEAAQLGAQGIVGVTIEKNAHEYEVETYGSRRTDMVFTFQMLGTAITPLPGGKPKLEIRAVQSMRL